MALPPKTTITQVPPGVGEQIDTGPGGFDVDGKTFTMDTGLPGDLNGYGQRHKTIDVDSDLLDANGKPKDISRPTQLTLAQYLSAVTMGKKGSAKVPNRYPIDPPDVGNPKPLRSTSDTAGNPTGPTPVADASINSFGGIVDPYTQQYPGIRTQLRKGKAPGAAGNAVDGNDLLRTEAGVPNSPVTQYQSAVLSHNRFAAAGTNSQSPYTTEDVSTPNGSYEPAFANQTTLGKYDPAAQTITAGRLAAVGPLLTMRAGLELGSSDPGADPNSAGLQAGAILPGFGQLGVQRIDQQLLLARDVLNGLTNDELDSVNVISPGSLSWGALNNTDDPFSGTDALGMLVLSTTLVAGVELVFDALSVLLGLITPSLKTPTRDAQGRYALGEYYPGSKAAHKAASGGIGGALSALGSLNFGALLGIQPTHYPFSRALTAGVNAFFGIPDDAGGGIGLNQLAGAVASSADSPGFNVVVARAIIRSSLTIVDQLKKIGGNVMNAINQILSLIDVIRNSKMISAINVFSMLGDARLSQPASFVDQDSAGGNKVSQMDSRDDVIKGAVGKSRLKGSLKLAWASNTAPANMLLPGSIIGASIAVKGLGQFSPFVGYQEDGYSQVQSTVTSKDDFGRISPEDAADFEKVLDASYVPFYFHDIRTNEMVSFHAFLAALTDDYTAAFDKSEGFGRAEAVKVYKSTERRISMAFYIAATSLLDFDEMWIKINKLTTMVYPQYTQGLTLQDAKDGNYKFTQPFSQLMGASPLIRIRLGDLIRSNYTPFALGRLFGMGNPDFKVDGESFAGPDIDQDVLNDLSAKLQSTIANPNDEIYFPSFGYYPQFLDTGGIGVNLPAPSIPGAGGADGPKFADQFAPQASEFPFFTVKVIKVHPDDPRRVIGEVQFNSDIGWSDKFSPGAKDFSEKEFNNPDKPLQRVIGGKYIFPVGSLTATPTTTSKLISALSAISSIESSNSAFATNLSAFLDPSNNAIAKSFKDTAGKGLAGFIETMNFDWYDKVTWETMPGRTAPKICKVTLTFGPVHDISPGIDHLGFNRAPLYPVGPMGPSPK